MILVLLLLILLVVALVNKHFPIVGCRRAAKRLADVNWNVVTVVSANSASTYSDFNDKSAIIEPIDNAAISLLFDMKKPEPDVLRLIVQTLMPYANDQDFFSTWTGGDDGTDDGTDALWTEFGNWHSDESVYADTAEHLAKACAQFANSASANYLDPKLFKIISTTFRKLIRAILDWPYKACTFPWGKNWYQFVVSVPYYMMLGIFHLYTVGKTQRAAIGEFKELFVAYVDKLYQSPVKAIGWSRTGSNTLLQGAPYILGHFWKGDLDAVSTTADFQYMIVQCNIVMVVEGEGLYPDYGWRFHTYVRAYGYLGSTINSANIINFFFTNNYGDIFNTVSRIMCHPTINANLPGLFSRTPIVRRQMSNGSFGNQLQYSDSIVNIKQKAYFMQFMGQQPDLAFYEADHTYNKGLALWMTARIMWLPGDTITQYDEATNIHYVPGNHVINREIVSLPSRTSTTDAMKPTLAYSAALLVSDTELVFFNLYRVDASDEAGMSPKTLFNGLKIMELMYCDATSKTVSFVYAVNEDLDEATRAKQFDGLEHVVETGIIQKKVDDHTYYLTNGKLVQILCGDLTIIEVEFDVGSADQPTETRKETHSVFLLTPTAFVDSETVDGDAPSMEARFRKLAYKVTAPLDGIPPKLTTPNLIQYAFCEYYFEYINLFLSVDEHLLVIPHTGVLATNPHVFYINTKTKKLVATKARVDMTTRSNFFAHRMSTNLPKGIIAFPTFLGRTGTKARKLYTKKAGDDYPEEVDPAVVYYTGDYRFQITADVEFDTIDLPKMNYPHIPINNWGFPDHDDDHNQVACSYVGAEGKLMTLDPKDLPAAREKYGTDAEIAPDDWEPFEDSLTSAPHARKRPNVTSIRELWAPIVKNEPLLVLDRSARDGALYYRAPSEREYYNGKLSTALVPLSSSIAKKVPGKIIVASEKLARELKPKLKRRHNER